MSGDDRTTPAAPGLTPQIVNDLEAAAEASPLDATLQITLAAAYETTGDRVKAAAARLAALALTERNAIALYNIATAYMNQALLGEAERWYRVALAVNPELAIAHQNLASLLRERGETRAAAEHLKRAYTLQAVYVEQGNAHAPRVLVACAGGIGNVPVKYLMPERHYTQIRYFVDYVSDRDLAALPAHDVVFNAIGDPDVIDSDDVRLNALIAQTNRTVLNPPGRVARTRRDHLPALLAGIEGARVPSARRIEPGPAGTLSPTTIADSLAQSGPPYPVILRPLASHGGQGMTLAHDRADVECPAPTHPDALQTPPAHADAVYATAFHDYRSADGYFRKYRMIFVDREPYPYHLAISDHWLVHYFSADMTETSWKLEEERRFLANPEAALGPRAYATLRAIAYRIDLDYAGIDFSLMPNGDVIVFEANATMLVHPEPANSPLAHKNVQVQTIVDAFARMIHKAVS
ncbi:MAG TPA: tetratricopeptide repeat protein [Pararobbsia sp.]|nr:tetratricopeptide repeat protein [Pararobbsia sp.]